MNYMYGYVYISYTYLIHSLHSLIKHIQPYLDDRCVIQNSKNGIKLIPSSCSNNNNWNNNLPGWLQSWILLSMYTYVFLTTTWHEGVVNDIRPITSCATMSGHPIKAGTGKARVRVEGTTSLGLW